MCFVRLKGTCWIKCLRVFNMTSKHRKCCNTHCSRHTFAFGSINTQLSSSIYRLPAHLSVIKFDVSSYDWGMPASWYFKTYHWFPLKSHVTWCYFIQAVVPYQWERNCSRLSDTVECWQCQFNFLLFQTCIFQTVCWVTVNYSSASMGSGKITCVCSETTFICMEKQRTWMVYFPWPHLLKQPPYNAAQSDASQSSEKGICVWRDGPKKYENKQLFL